MFSRSKLSKEALFSHKPSGCMCYPWCYVCQFCSAMLSKSIHSESQQGLEPFQALTGQEERTIPDSQSVPFFKLFKFTVTFASPTNGSQTEDSSCYLLPSASALLYQTATQWSLSKKYLYKNIHFESPCVCNHQTSCYFPNDQFYRTLMNFWLPAQNIKFTAQM